jgi:hypothetical protein
MSKVIAICLPLFLCCGCIRIPQEAIQVNTILHTNIQDAEKKHEALVHLFFESRREAMDKWFLETYEPEYLNKFKTAWNMKHSPELFDITKAPHRTEFEQNVISIYQEFSGELDDTEREFRTALDQAYGSMLSENEGIGRLLESAKAVSDAEKKSVELDNNHAESFNSGC